MLFFIIHLMSLRKQLNQHIQMSTKIIHNMLPTQNIIYIYISLHETICL